MKKTVAFLGGDLRQVYLARLFIRDGWDAVTWGLERGGAPNAVPLNSAIEAPMLILPLPVCRGGELNLPLTDTTLEADRLWPRLQYDQLLLGGQTKDLSSRLVTDFGLTLLDYYDREELQITNALFTAEGAIQRAMEETDICLHRCPCLVLGFGRIGKLLSHRLRAMGASVTTAARRYRDLAWCDALGYESLPFSRLSPALHQFMLIFNTVPSLVLDTEELRHTREDCLIMELASPPGGIDLDAASCLGRRVICARGLPGQAAPLSAAAALRDSIYHILEERGEPL